MPAKLGEIEKPCTKCKTVKPLTEYHKHGTNSDGKASWCKTCQKEKTKAWQKDPEKGKRYRIENKEKIAKQVFASHLKRKYELSLEKYEEKIKNQENRCQLCFRELVDPAVDHNHNTGQVRDILCMTHNAALGGMEESAQILENAIRYIKRHNNEPEQVSGCMEYDIW